MKLPFPARLHVLLASRAPVGLVLRRGPANAVCSLLWNRADDTFAVGQWVRARIYERRCDLSPDGRHLIYFARNSKWQSETKGSYTAISRAPWLKAIVLHGKGDCWLGGGLFTSDRTYWLNGGCMHFPIRDSGELRIDEDYRPSGGPYGGECPSVYYRRLQRDGWTLRENLRAGDALTIFEKPLPNGWLLRKYAHAEANPPKGKTCYWDEHELECGETRLLFPNWEWAELDGARLVWAEGGCLKAAPLETGGLGTAVTLQDFNKMQFEARIAPY